MYLLLMPDVQQGQPYTNFSQFTWQFINGNAAPHLWYNTMMLQFIICMPFFWWLARWAVKTPRRFYGTLLVTTAGYLGWLVLYNDLVVKGPQPQAWYLLDRVLISFVIYGIFGALAWKKYHSLTQLLRRYWGLVAVGFVGAFIWTNLELRACGYPVNLANASYYQPSMTLYSLAVIGLIAALAGLNLRQHTRVLGPIHFLATYAYRAYLANVFWLQILWRGFGHQLSVNHPVWTIISCYGLTWILAFASAYGLHWGWSIVLKLINN